MTYDFKTKNFNVFLSFFLKFYYLFVWAFKIPDFNERILKLPLKTVCLNFKFKDGLSYLVILHIIKYTKI